MKHLLNDISQEEKNRILEMYSSKKNVILEESSDPQQILWNQLVSLLQPLNPKKSVTNEKGHFIYAGENPLKTYTTTILTFKSGQNNEFKLKWPYQETEGGPHDSKFVNLFYTLESKGIGVNNGMIPLNNATVGKIKDLIFKIVKVK